MSQKQIITVTINPTLDRTLTIRHLVLGYHNRTADTTHLDPAGRGANISRALHRLNCKTHAVILLGDDAMSYAYETLINKEGFPSTILRRPGSTRSNITILDTADQTETTIIEDARDITHEAVEMVGDHLRNLVYPGDIVVFAGMLPKGVLVDAYNVLIHRVHESKALAVLHTEGDALREALKAEPDIVVIRQIKAEAYFNYPVRSPEDVIFAARRLREQGARMALISQIRTGGCVVLASEDGVWKADYGGELEAGTGTYSGVVDALLAGFLAGYVSERSIDESLELGLASAMYTIEQVGNKFGTFAKIQDYVDEVDLTHIDEQ